ncbi:MAG: 4-hydroxy-2-oxovalerate aldolase [Candidatus Omnitrophica bacterium]|nr:4-hydroxy-2-oxovalerate aldolase [Candidatus Omnitrophota bacterium]
MDQLVQRRRKLKKKLRSREKVLGAWTSFASPGITEIFAKSGVDFVGIDIEHSTISLEQSQAIITAAQAEGSLCLPRIDSHNMPMIKRLLDSGADGIIAPMVNNAGEADSIIEWTKYVPKGNRSFGIARGQGYGFDFDKNARTWNESSVIIPQIESREAAENIESILKRPDIDGVMIGPYDMSGSLGIPGQIHHKKVKDLCQHVIASCKKHKKACGTQNIEPDLNSLKKNFKAGFTFVILASDIFVLWKWAEKMKVCVAKLRK